MTHYRKLVIMETENGYVVEHRRESVQRTAYVAYICPTFKNLTEYVESYFEGGIVND